MLASAATAVLASSEGISRFISPDYYVNSYGYIGLAIIVFAETGLLLGFFLPGDSLLVIAGAFTAVSADPGKPHLNLLAVLVICFTAAVLGAQTGWGIGRFVGPRLFDKPDSKLFKRSNVDKAEAALERYGEGKAIIVARFLPIVRTFMNPTAGVLRVDGRRFAFYNVVGAALWVLSMVLLGRLFGEALHIDRYVIPASLVIIALSLIPILLEARKHRAVQAPFS